MTGVYKMLIFMLWVVHLVPGSFSCGSLTHMMISGRATEFFSASDKYTDYGQLLTTHKDALQGGSFYPDSFYDSFCAGGKYHNVSEDTHWIPFINASVNYIRKTYPHPWSLETQKLVVFLFGIMSHQTADVLWHSLGISQGFLSTMAKVNFHNDYSAAHGLGDLGGEFVSLVDLDAESIVDFNHWYIPSHDLFNIYRELYGSTKISLEIIESCSLQGILESYAVLFSKYEVYPGVIDRSPFLVQEMENYFIGGVNDMVGWTHRSWNNLKTMLEKGTQFCNMTYNPVFVSCNNNSQSIERESQKLKNGYFVKQKEHKFSKTDFEITKTSRGMIIQPRRKIQNYMQKRREEMAHIKQKPFLERKVKGANNIPAGKYMVNGSYARFGWSIASGDVDSDGYSDVIVGAPGYSNTNNWQRGRVYIIYGNDSSPGMFDSKDINLDDQNLLDITYIDGPDQMQARFGSSVIVLDVNLDGVDDIAVGSPSFGRNSPLDYNGLISIYFGKRNVRKQYTTPDINIHCQTEYCNLGYTLSAADIQNNGLQDLIIGAPFYSSKYEQSGIVSALYSSKNNKGNQTFEFEDLIKKWKLAPEQEQAYAWFGHNIKDQDTILMINSPNFRKCYFKNCSYSQYDIQCVGQSHVFSYFLHVSNVTLTGSSEYQSAGYAMDYGFPYDKTSWNSMIIAYSVPGSDGIGRTVHRGGSVILVNNTKDMSHVMAQFDGNSGYAQFGHAIKFADLNNDGMFDLIISEPHRSKDQLELRKNKNGRIYVFYGGNHMPTGQQQWPSKVANLTSDSRNEQSSNGFLIHVMSVKSGNLLLSSDVTSDAGLYNPGAGRRSGVVWRYYFGN